MKPLLTLFFIVVCCFVQAGEPPLLKPKHGNFNHTGLIQKYSRTHKGYAEYILNTVSKRVPAVPSDKPEEPNFEIGGVVGLFCVDLTRGVDKRADVNGAVVIDLPRPGEILVEIETTIQTVSDESPEEANKYRQQLRNGASQNEKLAGVIGDVQTSGGVSLVQDAALRRQAAGVDLKNVDKKKEKREYLLRGFDNSTLNVGDRITFNGIFEIHTEEFSMRTSKTVKVIEPYREPAKPTKKELTTP